MSDPPAWDLGSVKNGLWVRRTLWHLPTAGRLPCVLLLHLEVQTQFPRGSLHIRSEDEKRRDTARAEVTVEMFPLRTDSQLHHHMQGRFMLGFEV